MRKVLVELCATSPIKPQNWASRYPEALQLPAPDMAVATTTPGEQAAAAGTGFTASEQEAILAAEEGQEALSMLARALELSPHSRPSPASMLHSPWFDSLAEGDRGDTWCVCPYHP